jgi:DNA-directed RNA polymerase subunit RPC12/RpoP
MEEIMICIGCKQEKSLENDFNHSEVLCDYCATHIRVKESLERSENQC